MDIQPAGIKGQIERKRWVLKRWNKEPLARGNDSKAGNERDQVRVATKPKDHGSRAKINITTARPKERANTRIVPIDSMGTRRGV